MTFVTEVLSAAGGRAQNEDRCGYQVLDQAGCWVLADGLGGHGEGETAARIAVETVLQSFDANREVSSTALEAHVAAANAAVCRAETSMKLTGGLRTTVVILLSDFRRAVWAHVGDSRLYYLRGGRICFQTRDHSVPQAMVAAGDITADLIRFHEDRNRLLRALGNQSTVRAAISSDPTEVTAGDVFLLCTDGFWEPVTEAQIEQAFAGGQADALVRLEMEILGRHLATTDNYSAIAVRAVPDGLPERAA